MPKALERKLAREADGHGLTGERRDAYIYGTMAHIEAERRAAHTRALRATDREERKVSQPKPSKKHEKKGKK